jgi:hypothetical protein
MFAYDMVFLPINTASFCGMIRLPSFIYLFIQQMMAHIEWTIATSQFVYFSVKEASKIDTFLMLLLSRAG